MEAAGSEGCGGQDGTGNPGPRRPAGISSYRLRRANAVFGRYLTIWEQSNGFGGSSPGGSGAYQGIFEIIQSALDGEDQSDLISEKLALFSTNFILLCFCLVYAFKIIQASTNEFTDKFFSDAVFGGEVPIHHNLTAATKAAKDLAMKPIGFGRDVITHQSGRLLTHVYNRIRHSSFGGSVEATGKGVKQSGKVMKKAGQGIDKAGAALNKTKYGAIIGVPLQAAGKTTQAVGAVTEKAGQATEKAGRAIRKTQQKMKTSARILKRRLLKQNNSSES